MLGSPCKPARDSLLFRLKNSGCCPETVSFRQELECQKDLLFVSMQLVKDRALPSAEALFAGSAVVPFVGTTVYPDVAGPSLAELRTIRIQTHQLVAIQFHDGHPQHVSYPFCWQLNSTRRKTNTYFREIATPFSVL